MNKKSHTVKHASLLQKLFKRAPKTPAVRPEDIGQASFKVFTGPHQIQAFAEAYFDRLRYANGDADDMDIKEPGVTVRPVGFLDLGSEPVVAFVPGVTPDSHWLALSATQPERRQNRIRNGE